ncbi:MAG: circadian clock KaiB family protein [Rhodanobacteraceae bacterium]|nr:circadian clock KaiB family protein [Rhodanobacteraceae bacterium]
MSNRDRFSFRLYVADNAPNSSRAIANLTHFCHAYLPDQHDIEVVDVLKEPRRGLAEGIILTPTLIKLTPLPVRRIIGILSDTQVLRDALGLELLHE